MHLHPQIEIPNAFPAVYSLLDSILRHVYSRVHISSDSLFSKILKKQSILQRYVIPHVNGLLVFIEVRQKRKKLNT